MDYSEYLRQKKLAQNTFISRRQTMDAGLYTYIKQKAADITFVPPNSNAPVLHLDNCCPTHVSIDSFEVTAVKPASRCESAAMCAQLSNTYTTPYIVLPCCPRESPPVKPYRDASVIGGCYCYVGTPAQYKAAVGALTCVCSERK